ncbi:MAG TPA: alpha/beta hydrolase [Tepidisphaeraceae bacterium]
MRPKLSRFAATALIALLMIAFDSPARGSGGQYMKIDYPASTKPDELQTSVTYTMWFPDNVKTFRGIIVHQHGAGTTASIEGSTAAYDLQWQALAKKWDCALLGPSYHVQNEKIDLSPGGSEAWFDPRHGSEKTFLKAISEFAGKTGHPELNTVPWALWGHSGGGIWADVMACLHPDRVAVAWLRSGSAAMFRSKPEFPQPQVPEALYQIPMMCNPGAKEMGRGPFYGTLATFQEYRAHGAPIGFAPDPRTGHECGDSRYLAIPYIDACLALRLPEKGSTDQKLRTIDTKDAWLAGLMDIVVQPADKFQGDPKVAVWLPNATVAKAWLEYTKTGAVGDKTPPPAPYDIKIADTDRGAEVRWSADADFESGIRNFIVMRDGKELGSVPTTPVGKYGRPLYQSMTYHDTPAQPMPEMKFIDRSAKPGEKHSYEVITVNSVGLKSDAASALVEAAKTATPPAIAYVPFEGEKTSWHDGFDRYDYVMDENTFALKPYKRPANERFAVGNPAPGTRRCIVVVPKNPAPGNPWSWQGCYWDHEPQTEVELLRRGFHICFVSPDPSKTWDAWYDYLTEKHGLSKKPAFIGMSKGGVNEYDWSTANPDKVSCIYADNPAIHAETFANLGELAGRDVPLLNVCGTEDFLLQRHSLAIEQSYLALGGRITMVIKEGTAHHPHSIKNPKLVADWIVSHLKPEAPAGPRPAFVDDNFAKSYYYTLENSYIPLAEEHTFATARGPGFDECYERYDARTGSTWGIGGMAIIVPHTPAAGKPWVFRGNNLNREALVDQALLAKGYHIVIAPITAQAGPLKEQWDAIYKVMTENGFSTTPVMEGTGAGAGEAYAWAIENPSKVSCIVAENPAIKSLMAKSAPIEHLDGLAKAHIALLHECGESDPWLESQTRTVEKRYKEAGGEITIVLRPGAGHFLSNQRDVKSIVEFVTSHSSRAARN